MVNGLKTMIQIQNDVSISQLKKNSTLKVVLLLRTCLMSPSPYCFVYRVESDGGCLTYYEL